MTWVAMMVVPFVVPSTRTDSPGLMALAEVERVPVAYFVEDALVTVAFCPEEVDRVKLDMDTLATVPTAPPAAGPERALDSPLRNAGCSAGGVVAVVAVAELLVAVALTPDSKLWTRDKRLHGTAMTLDCAYIEGAE